MTARLKPCPVPQAPEVDTFVNRTYMVVLLYVAVDLLLHAVSAISCNSCVDLIPCILLWHCWGIRVKASLLLKVELSGSSQCQHPPANSCCHMVYATKLLCLCSDVHGDMSAIVLSLRWPATSLNQALEMAVHTPPHKSKYRSPEQQAASQRAQHRWGQVKMLHVEFYRARRCRPSSRRCWMVYDCLPQQIQQQHARL